MRWEDVAANWYAVLPRVIARWPDMEADELLGINGDMDHFLDYLHEHLGGDKVEAEKQLLEWLEAEAAPHGVADFAQFAERKKGPSPSKKRNLA